MDLYIEVDRVSPGIAVIRLAGKIVMGPGSLAIENLVADLVRENRTKVVFDLTRVYYVDSSGLGALASCMAKLERAGGGLRVAGASRGVRRLFEITALDKALGFYVDVAAALSSFAGSQERAATIE